MNRMCFPHLWGLEVPDQHGQVRTLFWVTDLLCPHMAEGARPALWSLFCKGTNPDPESSAYTLPKGLTS